MLKRKAATIAVLIVVVLTALGLRAVTTANAVSHIGTGSAYTTPADPIPLPISPPPH